MATTGQTGETLAQVRSHVATDHDLLAARMAVVTELAVGGQVGAALAELNRVRHRFALHVAGVADTLQSIACATPELLAGLKRDRHEVDDCSARVAESLSRGDAALAALAARRLATALARHATWEMVTLQ